MNSSQEHLPPAKQAQLRAISEIFREAAPVQMLILFGSHARGDWVEDEDTGYVSDYDLLAIVETEAQATDLLSWNELERRARDIAGRTPVTLIVHDIKFVNREIRIGQYFFSDIANEGIALFDSRRFMLAKPRALNAKERLHLAERNFAEWFDSASTFFRTSRDLRTQQRLKEAAFLLHQATERYYHAATLVFTGYKHRTHDIEKLGNLAGAEHPLLVDVLPKTEAADSHLFDLLKRAYIDARYSMSYRISAEELAMLQERVLVLADRVRTVCLEKIASLCGADGTQPNLPLPPRMQEPLLANLPPPPSDPAAFTGWAQSLAELSLQRGRTEGLREGELQGEAKALLLVLRARGIEIPPELEKQILACSDPALLLMWLKQAGTATRLAEIFEGAREAS